MKLLMTISGVSIVMAQAVVAAFEAITRFKVRRCRRKNHNVAVVATARKLAVIAWSILTTGEPYRYAQRAAAAKKLPSLRIAAGGEKRQGAARAV